jgi:hypothetical protein
VIILGESFLSVHTPSADNLFLVTIINVLTLTLTVITYVLTLTLATAVATAAATNSVLGGGTHWTMRAVHTALGCCRQVVGTVGSFRTHPRWKGGRLKGSSLSLPSPLPSTMRV